MKIVFPKKLQARMESIQKIEYALRKMCHRKSCKRIHQCPRLHSLCKVELNERTACYWFAANQVGGFINYFRPISRVRKTGTYPLKNDIEFAERIVTRLLATNDILSFHLTDKRNLRAWNLIFRASDTAFAVQYFLEEKKKLEEKERS